MLNESQIEKLIDIYSNTKNKDLVNIFNVSLNTIHNYRIKYSLKKSKEHISKNLSIRNKILGRDLNYENLKMIASKFNSRAEFQKKDGSAYQSARRIGILDDICSHMIKQSFSIPQMILLEIVSEIFKGFDIKYNDRTTIKPYEIDVYVIDKIAFEYNGKGWHLEERIDKMELFNKINLDYIIIKENNRNYEIDIKNQLKENLNILRRKVDFEIDEEYIDNIYVDMDKIYGDIVNMDGAYKIIKNSRSLKDFRTNNNLLYNRIRKLSNYKEIIKSIRTVPEYTDEIIRESVSKYQNLNDLIQNEFNIYQHIKRNKKEYFLEGLYRKKRVIDLDTCLDCINSNKIKTKYQLRKIDSSIYVWMKKNIGLSKINDYLHK